MTHYKILCKVHSDRFGWSEKPLTDGFTGRIVICATKSKAEKIKAYLESQWPKNVYTITDSWMVAFTKNETNEEPYVPDWMAREIGVE